MFGSKSREACEVHGHQTGSGNRMLLAMVILSLSLVVRHVWVTGGGVPLSGGEPAPFMELLGGELRDLLFGRRGILVELWEVLPYFLVGILIAGYLRTFKVAVKLQAKLRRYGVLSVFLASFVGIITPLCACGTVTTAISLLMAGIPLAPVMALMVTSPLLSPSTYLLTLNDLGPEWTVIRTISAFSMGIFAGLLTHFLSLRGGFRKSDIFIEGAIARGDFHDEDYPDERLRCNCRRKFGNRVAVRTGNRFLVFLAKSAEMLWVVGKYVIVGVVVGAVVERYVPRDWVYGLFGRKDPLNIVWVTLASVPIFLHQISASSIIYHIKGSLPGTLDAGAALAFMIGGPVTAVPTMVLFWTFFRKRVFFLYMSACLSGTILIAYAFHLLVFMPGVDVGNPLLKGVASLSGGRTLVIRKEGSNVRMVLDPAGKGVIATATNEVEGRGPVVFDGSIGRFTAATADINDNGDYICNVADWLKENSTSPVPERILVYGLGADPGALLGERVRARLERKGFTVRVIGRDLVPRLTGDLLGGYGQVWLFFGDGPSAGLSPGESKLLADHNSGGGGTLIVPGVAEGDGLSGANLLASSHGVTFAGVVETNPQIRVSHTSEAFNRMAQWLGSVLKIVRKA